MKPGTVKALGRLMAYTDRTNGAVEAVLNLYGCLKECCASGTMVSDDSRKRFKNPEFRTAKNGKRFAINAETGETSGLGPGIDGGNAVEANISPKHVNLNVKPNVSDTKTQEIIDDIYSGQGKKDQVGNGTIMDAIRSERKIGKPTGGRFHSKKGKVIVEQLTERIDSGRLSKKEKATVRAIRKDLSKALSGS